MGKIPQKTFETLIQPHLESLYRAAFRLTGNRHDAEDLVQDVCLRAYPRLSELRQLDYPRGWLMKVQYRLFVDGSRHRDRSPVRPMSEGMESLMVSQDPSPENLADGSLAGQRLQEAWKSLDKDQRALLALQVEGYSLAEMEQITELPTNAIKARLYRARVRLGKLLAKNASLLPRRSRSES